MGVTPHVFLWRVELDLVQGLDDHRFVFESVTLDAVDYQPFSFDFKLADISDDGVSEIIITMDNVSGDIEANIELAVGSSDHITVTYRPYLFDLDTGTQPVGATGCQMNPPLAMKVKSINANVFQISMRASFNDIVNRPFPPNVYTVEKFPGLVT